MNRLSLKALLSCALFGVMISLPAHALKSDTQQPIYISADEQQLDMQKNIVEFSGNVVLQQGTIDIRANRIVVERVNGQEGNEVIRAYGSQATFEQQLDDGGFIKARANRIVYTTQNEFLQMIGKARLEQTDSTIESNNISYRIDQQKLVAESEQGGRVTTVLQPKALNK
ncbi:lipopolysaccharide transport periplasmic protein LptA [Thaumasiovibrio subtropicus]|uniref:lipopolysaccharide transport periplasmic protein LptA n=1 Tax=Thaumasiovibrio subtropicus TaxID=1891207 RepID=UPI000B357339|nr:lipopolysaccharide transport periplasmic protein LptA [Thaumasiovibrio subtropicus]